MKSILIVLFVLTNALFADDVVMPPLEKVICDVTIVKYQENGTEERISILYTEDAAVILYDQSDAQDQSIKRGIKKLVGRPKEIIETTIDELFKTGSLRLGNLVVAKGPAKNRVEILVHRKTIGTWQTTFDKEQKDAWDKAGQFLDNMAKISN